MIPTKLFCLISLLFPLATYAAAPINFKNITSTNVLKTNDIMLVDSDLGGGNYATRTVPVALVGNTVAGTNYVSTTNTSPQSMAGALEIGANTSSGDDSALLFKRAVSGDSLFSHGSRDESTFNSTTTGGYASYDSAFVNISANNLNHLASFQSRYHHTGASTVDTLVGYNFAPVADGPANNAWAIHISKPTGTGVVSNVKGVYVDDLGSTNYAIHILGSSKVELGNGITTAGEIHTPYFNTVSIWSQGSGLNFLNAGYNQKLRMEENGNLGINTNAPSEALEVVGNIKASGSATAGSFDVPLLSLGDVNTNLVVDFSTLGFRTANITNDTWISVQNMPSTVARTIEYVLYTGDTNRNVIWQTGLSNSMGAPLPAILPSNNVVNLTLRSIGTTVTNVHAYVSWRIP